MDLETENELVGWEAETGNGREEFEGGRAGEGAGEGTGERKGG